MARLHVDKKVVEKLKEAEKKVAKGKSKQSQTIRQKLAKLIKTLDDPVVSDNVKRIAIFGVSAAITGALTYFKVKAEQDMHELREARRRQLEQQRQERERQREERVRRAAEARQRNTNARNELREVMEIQAARRAEAAGREYEAPNDVRAAVEENEREAREIEERRRQREAERNAMFAAQGAVNAAARGLERPSAETIPGRDPRTNEFEEAARFSGIEMIRQRRLHGPRDPRQPSSSAKRQVSRSSAERRMELLRRWNTPQRQQQVQGSNRERVSLSGQGSRGRAGLGNRAEQRRRFGYVMSNQNQVDPYARYGGLDMDSKPKKKLTTFDAMPWTKMKVDGQIAIYDGKFGNMVAIIRQKIGNMIQKTKTEFSEVKGVNKVVYVLGKIAKLLGVIALGGGVKNMVSSAKQLKGYCNETDEFMDALGGAVNSMQISEAEKAEAAQGIANYGSNAKGNAKKLMALKSTWGFVRSGLLFIAGHILEYAAKEASKSKSAPASTLETSNAIAKMDSAIKREFKKSKRHADIYHIIIGIRAIRTMSDQKLIREIMTGAISEDKFVRNFAYKVIDEINDSLRMNDYAPEIVQQRKQIKQQLMGARTIKDLLKVFPANPQLIKVDGLFQKARQQAWR